METDVVESYVLVCAADVMLRPISLEGVQLLLTSYDMAITNYGRAIASAILVLTGYSRVLGSYNRVVTSYTIGYDQLRKGHIRASVDALYRDDKGEISRDPRTKRLKTQRQ